MADISEIILFYSKFSQKCRNVLNWIDRYTHKLPVKKISIDSKEVRSTVMNGSQVKIRGVPTMMVVDIEGNAEVFESDETIVRWFHQLVSSSQQSSKGSHKEEDIEGFSDDEEFELIDEQQPKKTKSVKNIKEQKMADVKDLAKQMEMERKRTLGYDENQLPY